MLLRPLTEDDRSIYSSILHRAFNTWYGARGWPDYFGCTPEQASIFLDIYSDISPGRSVAAFDPNSGEIMGAWGAGNVGTHLFQVRGEFQPFNGVSLPSFLPETG